MICPNCKKSDFEENDLFCPNCGTDLKAHFKVQKYKTEKIALVSQMQNQSKSSLVLSQKTINEYQALTKEIQDLQEIPHKLTLSNQQLDFMKTKFSQDTNLLANFKSQQILNEKDIAKLKGLSVQSLISRIKGNKEQKLNKEEGESLFLLNKIEGLEKQTIEQQSAITNLTQHITDLKDLNTRLEQNKDALVKLIFQTTQGVNDPKENKLEKELQRLIKSYNPMHEQINKKEKILSCLNSAYSDLNYAYQRLQGASNNNNWDMFFGGGIILDSIKHSQMSSARDAVSRANSNIDLVRKMDPNLPGINAFVEDFSLFFNVMFDNIFTDWSVQNKINNSLSSVSNSLDQLDMTINRIKNDIDKIQKEFTHLGGQIANIHGELLKERSRMIEEAIKPK